MSELQQALLAIGVGVIIAVYVYGWWQQRSYRRKFGTAFKSNQADALYPDAANERPGTVPQSATAMLDEVLVEQIIAEVEIPVPAAAGPALGNLLDDACALLNARSDFVIELRLAEPSHAAALDGFWQRKFDFRKPVQVCGLTLAEKKWERAIAESQVLYERLRVALQLVDRGGSGDLLFCDLPAGDSFGRGVFAEPLPGIR